MLLPDVFGRDLFDDFSMFPFYDDRDMDKAEKRLYGRHARNLMKTDVRETDKEYIMDVDLPGFSKDEIKISLEDGYLTIEAAKGLDQDEKEKKGGRFIRRERYAGTCQRTFYVGTGVKESDIKAEFKQGILNLVIPKEEEKPQVEKKNYIAIEG